MFQIAKFYSKALCFSTQVYFDVFYEGNALVTEYDVLYLKN